MYGEDRKKRIMRGSGGDGKSRKCLYGERVHDWVRIKMWTRETKVVGDVAGAVGGIGG